MQTPLSAESLRHLLAGVDAGIQAHLAWNQRLLRCALLLESPGDDMLKPQSHLLCRFGFWFSRERSALDRIDSPLVADIDRAHARMHAAVTAICRAKLTGQAVIEAEVETYEREQSAMVGALSRLKNRIESDLARIDPLTGLPLRHGLESAFEQCRRDARRAGRQMFLAMIDLDHFKDINDSWGHQAGDLALQEAVARMRAVLRESDPLFRFGGEEFVVLLRCESTEAAQIVAQRLLEGLRAEPIQLQPQVGLTLTATLGLAEAGRSESLDETIARADHALLEGKLHGRDRFVLAQLPQQQQQAQARQPAASPRRR